MMLQNAGEKVRRRLIAEFPRQIADTYFSVGACVHDRSALLSGWKLFPVVKPGAQQIAARRGRDPLPSERFGGQPARLQVALDFRNRCLDVAPVAGE